MAISAAHYRLMIEHRDILPRGGDVLQIGEANWYGDVDPIELLNLAEDASFTPILIQAHHDRDLFTIARTFYAVLFAPSRIDSVDMHGTPAALRQDLNRPLKLSRKYDMSINHGTCEHVFHVAQVFASMHAWTKPGGLMIHESPWLGWPDHGFYSLHPTLFYDLAAANGYELVSLTAFDIGTGQCVRPESREHLAYLLRQGDVPGNACLFVVLRKGAESEFKIPQQGVYSGALDETGKENWGAMR